MRLASSRTQLFALFAVVAPLALAPGCATTQNKPANAALRAGDVKFVQHHVEIETNSSGETTSRTLCNLRMQNVGSEPINHIKFRLTLRGKRDGQLVYSRVHTLDIDIKPRDIATRQFLLQEFVYNIEYDYLFDELEVW